MANRQTKTKKTKYKIIISIALIISIITATLFIINNQSRTNVHFFDDSKKVINGIDVSQHNGKIDWDDVAKNTEFAFIRVGVRGYGTGEIKTDTRAKENLKKASKTNLPIGIYFYTQAINTEEAIEEAKLCIRYAKKYNVQLPIIIDYEFAYDQNGNNTGRLFEANFSRNQATAIINAFCETVIDSGFTPGVYASTNMYVFKINTYKINSKAIIWVADYNSKITYTGRYDIWQHTKNGKCNGIHSKKVDLNYWYQR